MKTVNLNKGSFFNDSNILEILNRIGKDNFNLMPHQLAVETGCSLEDAIALLILLYIQSVADGLLLIYHNTHPDEPPIMAKDLLDGYPEVPFVCEICQREINNLDELSFDLLFRQKKLVQFIGEIDVSP